MDERPGVIRAKRATSAKGGAGQEIDNTHLNWAHGSWIRTGDRPEVAENIVKTPQPAVVDNTTAQAAYTFDPEHAIKIVVHRILGDTQRAEPIITKQVAEVATRFKAKLENLQGRLMSEDAVELEVIQKVLDENEPTVDDAAQDLCDTLRYYVIMQPDDYLFNMRGFIDHMKGLSYGFVREKNYWDEPFYKGFNVVMRKGSLKFTLAFHTPDSYMATISASPEQIMVQKPKGLA